MISATDVLLGLFEMEEIAVDQYRCAHPNEGGLQIFGGQLIAQALCAANKALGENKQPVSIKSTFIAAGKVNEAVTFRVETLRKGRAFSSIKIDAVQEKKTFFSMTVVFHVDEPSSEFQQLMPQVARPEDSADLSMMVIQYKKLFPDHIPDLDPKTSIPPQAVESRFPDLEGYFSPGKTITQQPMWMRFDASLPDFNRQTNVVHQAILAFTSDQGISHVIAQSQGLGGLNPNVRLLSLDHAVWFHRPFRADEWFLMVRRCESFSSSIAMVTGEFYDTAGNMIATMSQQTLYRF